MRERFSNYKDDSIVKIKPIAYYKMLVHILRYGSKTRARHKFKEVMGMIIGHLEGNGKIKDVIIEDAVPVSHGGSIEVDFSASDYGKFEPINLEAAERNMFTLGWYHSHPGLSIFFSGTDIRNQLGWQAQNPSAIGLVFDHEYLESPGDLGFRTFRLDDPNKGDLSGYHEVKTIVEIPDSLDFYDNIIDLIKKFHSGEPPILELNEKFNIFDDINIPTDSQFKYDIPQLDQNKMINKIQNSITGIFNSILNPIFSLFNNWSHNLGERMINNNLLMKNTLKELKNILITEIEQLQNTILFTLQYNLTNLDIYIDDRFDVISKDFQKIVDSANQLEDMITNKIKDTFEDFISKSKIEIDSMIDPKIENIEYIITENKKIKNDLNKQNEMLKNLDILINEIQSKLLIDINHYYRNQADEFDKINEKNKESLDQFEKKLQTITLEINNLNSNYQNSTNILKNKIKALNEENSKLKNQIEEKRG